MQNIKHIFFDLDNTLWDHRKNAKLTLIKLFAKYDCANKYQLGFEEFHVQYDIINEEMWAKMRDEKIDKAYLRKHRFYDTFLKFGIDDFELSQNFENQFLDDIVEFNELVDGSLEILDYLTAKEYKLHIITNGFEEVSYRKIEGSGMKNYFETVTSADSLNIRKPNPKIFEHALQIANATKEESILIGDDWIADVLGAKNFGLDVIFFDVFNDQPALTEIKRVEKLVEIEMFL
ncbi:YjjG family noncanonical pyrimidine nucleotidase [Frigoriflavimonas asaccharolytica]|uniref:Putative hydrolase of the HAD superfamily n=1 Tax=Frigoriflavimonas asaccharolytica TaxID=2735899 RepID=A0A8J8K6H5_9FLAO|nr:YjjG family noncanonical pyrimidine nucleotidase [Frigoriflavimonas asaccharolytica]NRS90963.1 putative hydrolase of the HAD superfamily [Frigoriflavimonas asaccharolytica]